MKKILVFCFVILCFAGIHAQGKINSSDSEKVYTIVQRKPAFPGDVNKFLADNIRYPGAAIKKNVSGTVYVQFVVEKDGSVSSVHVLRSVNKWLDAEAVRVISIMPKWTPGTQDGIPVRVEYMVPIHFILR